MDRSGIEGPALSFTAGVILSALALPACAVHTGTLWWTVCTVSLLLSAWFVVTIFGRQRSYPRIYLLFFLSGMFCQLCSQFGCKSEDAGYMVRFAESSAENLRTKIDCLHFSDAQNTALVKALTTGDRSGISREIRDVFRLSGASHILALSGMHLGIVYGLLLLVSSVLGNKPIVRKLRSAGIVLITGFYTLACGTSPSLLRAFIFVSVNEVLKLTGRREDSVAAQGESAGRNRRILWTSLLLQLALNPLSVRSTGFQLSYLAMFGIFYLFPILENWYPGQRKTDPVRKIWKLSALSISCQLFTAPLAWAKFGIFPKYFLLTNLIALPLTSVIMSLSIAALVLSCLGVTPSFLVRLDSLAVSTLVSSLTIISGLP